MSTVAPAAIAPARWVDGVSWKAVSTRLPAVTRVIVIAEAVTLLTTPLVACVATSCGAACLAAAVGAGFCAGFGATVWAGAWAISAHNVSSTAGGTVFIGRSLYPIIPSHQAEGDMKSALIHVNLRAAASTADQRSRVKSERSTAPAIRA